MSGSSRPKRGWQLPAWLSPSRTGTTVGSRFPREVRRGGTEVKQEGGTFVVNESEGKLEDERRGGHTKEEIKIK